MPDSMRRFDNPSRGKLVAKPEHAEQPPLSHEDQEVDSKDLLH